MHKYIMTKTFTFYDEDIFNVIESAVYSIGYWTCIDNDTPVWHKAHQELSGEAFTFEDVFFHILQSGKVIHLIDVEDEEEVWELTFEKLLHGIQLAIDNGDWDGDADVIDGDIGDVIFQYALFDEVVFG